MLRSSGSVLDDETRQAMQTRFSPTRPVPGRLAISMATVPASGQTEDAAEQAADQAMAAPVRAHAWSEGAGRPVNRQAGGEPDFGDVRIHVGPGPARAAAALGAPAFTVAPHIVFGAGRFDPATVPGQRLLAHELAHVVQQRERPLTPFDPIPRGPVPPGPGAKSPVFTVDLENQAPPPVIRGRVDVAVPSLTPGKRAPVVPLLFDVTVTPIEVITLYAVPDDELFETEAAAALRPGKDREDQSFRLRGWPIPAAPAVPAVPAVPSAPPVKPPVATAAGTGAATVAGTGAAPVPAPTSLGRFHTSSGPIDIVARGDGFGITGSYTKLAVGAGSTTLADTPRGLIVIDAGTSGGGSGKIAQATVDRMKAITPRRNIVDMLFTHGHRDHTALAPKVASEFEIGNLHINLAQALDPDLKFDSWTHDIGANQRFLLERQLRAQIDKERVEWENTHDVPNESAREAQWKKYADQQLELKLDARKPIGVDLQVPGKAGELYAVSAPIGTIDPASVEFAPGRTGGVLRTATTSAIVNKDISELIDRLQKGGKPTEKQLDRYATTYVLIVDQKILALVLPDMRVDDIRAIKDTLKAEMIRLGHKADIRTWDIGHHLQKGFLGATGVKGDPASLPIARVSQLGKLTEVLHELAGVKNSSGRLPADVVAVSVNAAKIDPVLALVFESMGFTVIPAVKGQDVRLVEAFTATSRRVAGLAGGEPYVAGSAGDPLLRRAHAAIDELTQKAADLESRANKLSRKKVDQPERERLRDESKAVREKIAKIKLGSEAYIRQANQELGPRGDAIKKGPRAAGAPEPAAAQAQALRAELIGFDRPVVGTLGRFSDVAVVLLGGEVPADARAELKVIEEVRELQAQLETYRGTLSPPELRARYLNALETKRNVVRRRLAQANQQGDVAAEERKVLGDEMSILDKEVEVALKAATSGRQVQGIKQRLPNGKLVETTIEVPKQPTTFERGVKTAADALGRGLGAVMVYQHITGEVELEEKYAKNQASGWELGVGTVQNVYGMSIGVRMLGAVHVAPGEFIVMAALDITQTALRDYTTTGQRNAAIAYSVIRNALSLGLMAAGSAIMKGGPWGMIVGMAIMFLADPILDALGVYDWLERKFDFMPDEVVEVNQKLTTLLDEYRVIVGAIQISERTAQQLADVGATNQGETRKVALQLVSARRGKAKEKESQLLVTFLRGYEAAKKSYGGLPQLDEKRAQFLAMMLQAQGPEAPKQKSEDALTLTTKAVILEGLGLRSAGDLTSREKADAMFHTIEMGMTLANLTGEQIREMPQWSKMDTWMAKIRHELAGTAEAEIDWKFVAEKTGELDQMFANARYRINPALAGVERASAMIPAGTPARFLYERELTDREYSFGYLRQSIAGAAAGVTQAAEPGLLNRLMGAMSPFPKGGDAHSEVTLEASVTGAEAAVATFRAALLKQPALGAGLTPESIASHSSVAGTDYPNFVNANSEFKRGLFRMKTLESAMRTSLGQVHNLRRATAIVTPELENRITALVESELAARQERSEVKSFLYQEEIDDKLPMIRARENLQVAGVLGQKPDVKILSPLEQEAAGKGALKPFKLTTVANRLAQITQLEFPTEEEIAKGRTTVRGIYKVVGSYDETDLFVISFGGTTVSESDNVLVGFVRERGETTSGAYGHTMRTEVTPLNSAAVRVFGGTANQTLMQNILRPATLDDVRKGEVQAGPVK